MRERNYNVKRDEWQKRTDDINNNENRPIMYSMVATYAQQNGKISRNTAKKTSILKHTKNKSVFSFLRQLTTRNCPHLLLCAVLWRGCGWPPVMQQLIHIFCLLGKQQQTLCSGVQWLHDGTDRQTDRQRDGLTHARQFHRPCSAYYTGSCYEQQ